MLEKELLVIVENLGILALFCKRIVQDFYWMMLVCRMNREIEHSLAFDEFA